MFFLIFVFIYFKKDFTSLSQHDQFSSGWCCYLLFVFSPIDFHFHFHSEFVFDRDSGDDAVCNVMEDSPHCWLEDPSGKAMPAKVHVHFDTNQYFHTPHTYTFINTQITAAMIAKKIFAAVQFFVHLFIEWVLLLLFRYYMMIWAMHMYAEKKMIAVISSLCIYIYVCIFDDIR